ncbi:MAG: cysteine rich repeat-containing protein [Hyphomicrobium sp.]
MPTRTTLASLCLGLGLCLGATATFAADDAVPAPAGTGKHWAACQAEITKFCSNIEKGKGKMRACLTERTADLSDGCKTSMAEHAAKAKEKEKSGQ